MDKFDNIYRIESSRLKNWDYGANAYYYITICTQQREHFFGEIEDSRMIPNEIGKIVETEWLQTPIIRPDMNLKMGEFVVMPNHFHAIIFIGKNRYNSDSQDYEGRDAMHRVSTEQNRVSTEQNHVSTEQNRVSTEQNHVSTDKRMHCVSVGKKNNIKPNKFGPQSKNLASILRGFKSSVTTNARKINPAFSWQSRFHDHIIRDKNEWYAITNYIKNNPKNWKDDDLFN